MRKPVITKYVSTDINTQARVNRALSTQIHRWFAQQFLCCHAHGLVLYHRRVYMYIELVVQYAYYLGRCTVTGVEPTVVVVGVELVGCPSTYVRGAGR